MTNCFGSSGGTDGRLYSTMPPNGDFETPYGNFSTNDGVLTVRNPRPQRRRPVAVKPR
jgi:hypothetical protein